MARREALQPGVVVSVVGPTASGKTELAIALAKALGTEIVNADARQVFRGMPIGTAQPTAEERSAAPHHLVDFLDPTELYSAGTFEEDAVPLLSNLCTAHGSAILAGGSGMYIKAALQGLDSLPADTSLRAQLTDQVKREGLAPLLARLNKLDPGHVAVMDTSNPQRVVRALEVCIVSGRPFSGFHSGVVKHRPWHVVSVGLDPDRAELRERIAHRARVMMDAGGSTRPSFCHTRHQCVEHGRLQRVVSTPRRHVVAQEAVELVITRTRQFAKRQMTWSRTQTTWFSYESKDRLA